MEHDGFWFRSIIAGKEEEDHLQALKCVFYSIQMGFALVLIERES